MIKAIVDFVDKDNWAIRIYYDDILRQVIFVDSFDIEEVALLELLNKKNQEKQKGGCELWEKEL